MTYLWLVAQVFFDSRLRKRIRHILNLSDFNAYRKTLHDRVDKASASEVVDSGVITGWDISMTLTWVFIASLRDALY